MMTINSNIVLVEFFDSAQIENIMSALYYRPGKIIYVGGESVSNFDEKHRAILEEYFMQKSLIIEDKTVIPIEYREVDPNNLLEIEPVLTEIIVDNGSKDCLFDLTGGEDLLLLGLGIVSQDFKYNGILSDGGSLPFNIFASVVSSRAQASMHLRRIEPNTVKPHAISLYGDQDQLMFDFDETKVWNSIEENILIHGGKLKSCTRNFDDSHFVDINALWNIFKTSKIITPGKWNMICDYIAGNTKKVADGKNSLIFNKSTEGKPEWFRGMFGSLFSRLVENDYIEKHGSKTSPEYRFKNLEIKRLLTSSGSLLEQKIFMLINSSQDIIHTDIATNVVIDWEGFDENPLKHLNVTNEIDIMLMQHFVPVFISCKNGAADTNELYKLNAVSDEFGSKYAKKILILTRGNKINTKGVTTKKELGDNFFKLAAELDIHVIRDVHKMTDAKIVEAINDIICQ